MFRRTSTIVLAIATLACLVNDLQAAVIVPTGVTSPTPYYTLDDRAPIHTIDSSGMTAGSPWDTAGTDPGSDMWLMDNVQTGSITWDLGGIYRLSDLHLWNYNESGGFALRSVKTADVQISLDNVHFTDLGVKTFIQAPGTTGYAGEDYSFLNNLNARYVQFNVQSSFGGFQAGDNYTGLSEIRFVGIPSPEPTSFVLGGLGVIGLLLAVRRRRA